MDNRSEQSVSPARLNQAQETDGKYWLTIAETAERFRVSRTTVGRWIRTGLLSAIDVSPSPTPNSHRPSWRISPEKLEAFVESRASAPPPPPRAKPRHKVRDIIEFIK